MPEIQWYYSQHDQMMGPVSSGELRRLAQTGELVPSSLVWREGMGEWAPAAKVRGLFADAASPAPRAFAETAAGSGNRGNQPHGDPYAELLSQATHTPDSGQSPVPAEIFRSTPNPDVSPDDAAIAAASNVPPNESPHDVVLAEPSDRPTPSHMPPLYPTASRPRSAVAGARVLDDSTDKVLSNRAPSQPVVDLLWWGQVILWGLCTLTVFVGGLLFLAALIRAKAPYEEASAAAVYGMFAVGAYVLARAGERLAALLLYYFGRKRP
jgi:hypothetical protein